MESNNHSHATTRGLSPILIVPGWTGMQLEARISDGSLCDTKGEWVSVWYNPDMTTECVTKVLELQYDDTTNTYSNSNGVEVRMPGFGKTDGIEYYDEKKTKDNYKTFIEYFEKKGYVRGETIKAAPYDWRLASDSLAKIGYYDSLKALVEEMYEDANNEKVSIVAHSMGGPVTLYFFNNIVTQDWKDKYINVYVPLSGAWAGLTNMALFFITATMIDSMRDQLGPSSPKLQSIAWLLPNPLIWKDKVILSIENTSYTANDYQELLKSIDREKDHQKIQQVHSLLGDYPSPNVPTHCLYGVGVPTTEVVNYGHGFPRDFESLTNGDGDGSINTVSSEVCLKWSNQKQPFKAQAFENINHLGVLRNDVVLDTVAEAILDPSNTKVKEGFSENGLS